MTQKFSEQHLKNIPAGTAGQVPVLVTWDVDRYNRELPQKRKTLQLALDVCRESGISSTFFFVAQEAENYPDEIVEMKRAGHEIGCHGLTHGKEEVYDRMPQNMQQDYIEQATRLLEDRVGLSITAFRGPRVKISATTLSLLADYGYLTDSSVCPQRLDLISSNLVNPGWLAAPRLPYQPHKDNAFKRGNLNILEVPVSALVVPFISSSLYVFRLSLFKLFFNLLYAEARRTGKPIVYLAHPAEFGPQSHRSFKLSSLSLKTLRTVGVGGRKHLGVSDPKVHLELHRALFAYMATFPNIRFMTMRQYAQISVLQGE